MNIGRADSRLDFFLLVKLFKASPEAKEKISFRKQKNVTLMVTQKHSFKILLGPSSAQCNGVKQTYVGNLSFAQFDL